MLFALQAASATPRAAGQRVHLPPGATLVLYTDGVSEARDAQGAFLDPVAVLDPSRNDPDAVTATLVEAVTRHAGGRPADDATILAVQRPALATAPVN